MTVGFGAEGMMQVQGPIYVSVVLGGLGLRLGSRYVAWMATGL